MMVTSPLIGLFAFGSASTSGTQFLTALTYMAK